MAIQIRVRERLIMLAVATLAPATGAIAAEYCTPTARLQLTACRAETTDDYNTALAICLNESNSGDRNQCNRDAVAERDEHSDLCEDQFAARKAVCARVGESRYDPDFVEANFVSDFRNPGISNPYFPLAIGNTWDYESQDETGHIEVLADTKLIDDVTCLVVRDQVSVDGLIHEDTDDRFALDRRNGNVWYCGEEVKDYETFDGDEPPTPELVAIDGSFKVDRDGAKAGIISVAAPARGQFLRQEYSLGNAEDVIEILETQYVYGKRPQLDELVPKALADYFCGPGCVVTGDSNPLEPDAFERKYYARGIGLFLETNPETGEVNRLVDCSFSPRCAALPQP